MRPSAASVSLLPHRDLINDWKHMPLGAGRPFLDNWVLDYNLFRPQMSLRSRTLYGFGDSCDV